MKKLLQLSFCFFFFAVGANAQLPDFTLQVNKTNETCAGNGTMTFTVSNVNPQSTILFKVFKLPNTSNPVAILTTNYIGGLSAGTYRVEAIQALGSQQNVQKKDVTIGNNIGEFNFNISASHQSCAQGGNIVVNANIGIAVSYEIIAGPVTRPMQGSNTFSNMPSGTYKVRAYNDCGTAKVKTYTLSLTSATLVISEPSYPDLTSPLCDKITVNNTITPTAGNINYPLTVTHTLAPMSMSGQSIIVNNVYNSGPADALVVSQVMPRHITDSYTYDIAVTDNCNALYEKIGIEVDPSINLSLATGSAACGEKFLVLNASKHTPPYNVEFLETPADFVAGNFNNAPQGPFTLSSINYGSNINPIPFGNYVVKITDLCGRTATDTLLVEFVKPVPSARANNNGCFSLFGRIRISVPEVKIVNIVMTGAPENYENFAMLPIDLSASINAAGTITLQNMPLGTYTFNMVDDCGNIYEDVEVEVPPFVEQAFNIATLPDCNAGFGTMKYSSGNGVLTAASIVDGPAGFVQYPHDVTSLIDENGILYLSGLPQGEYTFTATDFCEIVDLKENVIVEGYVPPTDAFAYLPSCGSFSITMRDASNGTEGATFWLQKLNPATNVWGHPSGTPYIDGTEPTAATGVKLNKNATRNNLNFTGTFRVIKKFETYSNGDAANTLCISQLGEPFEYYDIFEINNAYSLACLGQDNDVYLEVQGYPVSYRIVKKNGENFIVENGTDNIFRNLDKAEYVFEIEDICGNKKRKMFDMQTLPSLADATKPMDMLVCAPEGTAGTNNVYHLTDQNAAILGNLPSVMYTITYHLTQEDADNGVNSLNADYTATSNGQTIYVRLINNEIDLCHGTTSFQLFIGEYPVPGIITKGMICDGGKMELIADKPYGEYIWSTGETTRSIFVSEPGMYSLSVKKDFGNTYCQSVPTEVTVTESGTPEIVKIETTDWSEYDNTITVHTTGIGQFEYSLDGTNFQPENVFTGLNTGAYKVYVRDADGCGMDMEEVVLMYYPNFFTPNNDGTHDKWHIKYAVLEPHLTVTIMDRYGKHITTFGASSEGWDGNLNGVQLPSTDYWFVVTREDGRELKGHFAMLR